MSEVTTSNAAARPVQKGDELQIFPFSWDAQYSNGGERKAPPVEVQWHLSMKFGGLVKENYYEVIATNKSSGGGKVLIYIAKDWYDNTGKDKSQHVTKAFKETDYTHHTKGGSYASGHIYTATVDDRFQYGQMDAAGKGRFLVYHPKTSDDRPRTYQFQYTFPTASTNGDGTGVSLSTGGLFAARDMVARWIGYEARNYKWGSPEQVYSPQKLKDAYGSATLLNF